MKKAKPNYEFAKKIIRVYIAEQDISQKEFAKKVGITEAALSRFLKGMHTPNSITICTIANEIGVTPNYLLGLPTILNEKFLAEHNLMYIDKKEVEA